MAIELAVVFAFVCLWYPVSTANVQAITQEGGENEQVAELREKFHEELEALRGELREEIREELLRELREELREKIQELKKTVKIACETAFELEAAATGDRGSYAAQQEGDKSVMDRIEEIESKESTSGDESPSPNEEKSGPVDSWGKEMVRRR